MKPQKNQKSINSRFLACQCLLRTFKEKKNFDTDLPRQIAPNATTQDQDFIAYMVYGVLRHYELLAAHAAKHLKKPIKSKDFDIYLTILLGIYQLQFMRVPTHAAVHETVQCATLLKKVWAKGLINAILNRVAKQPQPIDSATLPLAAQYSHPEWFIDRIKHDWPHAYEDILSANNTPPPITLRINATQMAREDYLDQLTRQHIDAEPCQYAPMGITLFQSCRVPELPFYQAGAFSVQDQAAQFAADILEIESDQHILDACAAPGGKTTHILEKTNQGQTVYAVEKNPNKIQIIADNLKRLKLNCSLIQQDACELHSRWPTPEFDRILLDPPCSATGVIRRHPDIKYLRTQEDLTSLQNQQRQLLKALWPLLKTNGMLVYSTCSVLLSENEDQMAEFLQSTPDAQIVPIEANWGLALQYGRQILPGENNMDGFYYAKIRKVGLTKA